MYPQAWTLDGGCARLELPGLTARIDSARPHCGLTAIVVRRVEWSEARLLGVTGSALNSSAMSLTDWHARGGELIAAYEIGAPHAARIDLCWHAAAGDNGDSWFARIDLIVSVRTDRLDWRHDVRVESDIRDAAALPGGQGCSRFALREWSYAEFIHPADLGPTGPAEHRDGPGRYHLRRRLFQPETLEKGVILRARIRGLFLPPAAAPADVDACYAEFIAADPPLGS
jgi:hypothetical protein